MNRNIRKIYNEWSHYYDESLHILHSLEKKSVIDLVEPKIGDNILDVGCGTGAYSILLAKKFAKVVGIDFSSGMIKIAKIKVPAAKFFVVNIENRLPFGNKTFNKIVCAQALQHIKDIEPVLIEFKRVLKNNGTIIFSIPHPEMDRTYYKTKAIKGLTGHNFTIQSGFFNHKFCDYLEVIDKVNLKVVSVKNIPITTEVKQFFLNDIFKKNEGKYLGVIFKLTKMDF